MIHKAWCIMEQVPNCFSMSSVKFQGHTGHTIADFDRNSAFPVCNSISKSPMAFKWYTELHVVKKRCPIILELIYQIWKIDDVDHIWARLLGRSQLLNPSDLPCSLEISNEDQLDQGRNRRQRTLSAFYMHWFLYDTEMHVCVTQICIIKQIQVIPILIFYCHIVKLLELDTIDDKLRICAGHVLKNGIWQVGHLSSRWPLVGFVCLHKLCVDAWFIFKCLADGMCHLHLHVYLMG